MTKRGRRPPAWQRWLHRLQTGSAVDAVEAAKAFRHCRSRNGADALVAIMRGHHTPLVGELAAYALLLLGHRRFIRDFVACLNDQSRPETVRGQAAEALGWLFDCARADRRDWLAVESSLLSALADPSPTVRFWCCYALACLKSERAREPLASLCENDHALIPGWWYVHEEAANALEWIDGREGRDLVPVHLRQDPVA